MQKRYQSLIIVGGEQKHQGVKFDNICTTLTSSMGTGGGYVPMVVWKEKEMILGHLDENSNQRYVVYDKDDVSPTLQTVMGTGGGQTPYVAIDEQNMSVRSDVVGTLTTDGSSPKHNNRVMDVEWRIRKITPKEAFRLMDFSDEDFNKAQAVNSNCQLFKQAGNSIVQNVLVAALGQLFEGKEDVYKKVNERHQYHEVGIEDVMVEPICLNSKGGRGGIEGLQPSIQDRVYSTDGSSTAITTAFRPSIMVVGQMDNTIDHTFESQNRVYDPQGISPTINTYQGGNLQAKVLVNDGDKDYYGKQDKTNSKETCGQSDTDGYVQADGKA